MLDHLKCYKWLNQIFYVINLPPNFSISSTFNIINLVIYKLQHLIPDDPFETLTPLPLSLAQKECINAILNAKVIFTKDGEVQRISIRELDDQIDSDCTWIIRETLQQLDFDP